MSFRVFLYEEVVERIESYTSKERQCVYENLDRLAEAPIKLSRRSAPPASLPGYQLFTFFCNKVYFNVTFKYADTIDEATLIIYGIGRAG